MRLMLKLIASMIFAVSVGLSALPARAEMTLFAAASLTDVLEVLSKAYSSAGGEKMKLVLGSSSDMARQIVAGAPADLFISANKDWALEVGKAGFGAPLEVFGNRLVIISSSSEGRDVELAALPDALNGGWLALGDPDHVPAGIYAKAALTSAGLWESLKDHIAPAADVRAAVNFVASGAAPFGIVYATDARLPGVRVAGRIDTALYPPVSYYLVLPAHAEESAKAFADYLATPEALAILADFGFTAVHGDK